MSGKVVAVGGYRTDLTIKTTGKPQSGEAMVGGSCTMKDGFRAGTI